MGQAKRRKDRQQSSLTGREDRRRIFERVRQATVGFAVVRNRQQDAEKTLPTGEQRDLKILGSGVVVDESGIILTARHVVEEIEVAIYRGRRLVPPPQATVLIPGSAQLTLDGDEATLDFRYVGAPLQEVRLSNVSDLAAIRLKDAPPDPSAPLNLTTLLMDAHHDVFEGDPVAACGWPYGTEMHEGRTILSSFVQGVVSAVVPHPKLPPAHRTHYMLQIPVSPGNSGGPVFDPDTGEVYGIVSRRYDPKGIPAGLCIAEPIGRILDAIKEWQEQ